MDDEVDNKLFVQGIDEGAQFRPKGPFAYPMWVAFLLLMLPKGMQKLHFYLDINIMVLVSCSSSITTAPSKQFHCSLELESVLA